MEDNALTPEDRIKLRDYLTKKEALDSRKPAADSASEERATWDNDVMSLDRQYNDIILKAIATAYQREQDRTNASVTRLISAILSDDSEGTEEALLAIHTGLRSCAERGIMHDKVNRCIAYAPARITYNSDGQETLQWAVNLAQSNRAAVPVSVRLSLEYDGGMTTSRPITGADDAVFTAVSNITFLLRQSGKQPPYNISPQDIWREVNGISDSRRTPTEKQLRDVCRSVDKMRFTRLRLDLTQEIRAGYLKIGDERIRNGHVDDYYLPARKIEIRMENGKRVDGYQLYDVPFLYAYNRAKGHIVLVPWEMLRTLDSVPGEGLTITFRNYLLREIALMYAGQRDSRKILYGTIYEQTGSPKPEERLDRGRYTSDASYRSNVKKAAAADRKKIAALLDFWVGKRWILGYIQTRRGRAYDGIEVTLNPENFSRNRR